MNVRFREDGHLALENVEDFASFKAVCGRSDATVEDLCRLHPALVKGTKGADHIWLDVEAVAALAPPNPEWRYRYDGMMEYAAAKGWIRGNPAQVASHVVWERKEPNSGTTALQ